MQFQCLYFKRDLGGLQSDPMSSLRVVVVCPQMLSVALLCVCAVAFGHVSARSDSGNFLDDKWLAGRWDKFRDVSNIPGFCYKRVLPPYSLIYTPPPFSPIATLIGLWSCAPRFLVVSKRRVTGARCGVCHTFISRSIETVTIADHACQR